MTTKTWVDLPQMIERIERIEQAIVLLSKHVGATGWNKELQVVLDAIQYETREMEHFDES